MPEPAPLVQCVAVEEISTSTRQTAVAAPLVQGLAVQKLSISAGLEGIGVEKLSIFGRQMAAAALRVHGIAVQKMPICAREMAVAAQPVQNIAVNRVSMLARQMAAAPLPVQGLAVEKTSNSARQAAAVAAPLVQRIAVEKISMFARQMAAAPLPVQGLAIEKTSNCARQGAAVAAPLVQRIAVEKISMFARQMAPVPVRVDRLALQKIPIFVRPYIEFCNFHGIALVTSLLLSASPHHAISANSSPIHPTPTPLLPSLDAALASKQDLWGLAAVQQTDGPSYEFFAPLLPPLRYVNAAFRHYPIVLSAPGAGQKGRLVSNGSAINARAELRTWKDAGLAINFYVRTNEVFGENFARVRGPVYADGYLPVVKIGYATGGAAYEEETFASVDPQLAVHGVLFTRFSISNKPSGLISAVIDSPAPFACKDGMLMDTNEHALLFFGPNWTWNADAKALTATLTPGKPAVLVIPRSPLPHGTDGGDGQSLAVRYEHERRACVHSYQGLLDGGAQFITPESVVNDAWRSLLVGQFMMMKGNAMDYSHGNAYERLYQAECGDAIRALALFGQTNAAAKTLPSLLDYTRDALKYHNAGFKLQTLSHLYWLTHDTNLLNSLQPKWMAEVDKIVSGREKESGLFPREQYCGDIFTSVYSLHSAGAAWRGLRDFATILSQTKNQEESATSKQVDAQLLLSTAADLRRAILAATDKSEFTNTEPAFVPVALFGEEKPYDPLTASMLGSYWDLIAPYMLGSGMFGPGSRRERAIIDYLQEHGGVFMGMIRFHQHSGLFGNEDGVDDLYGLRYTTKLLQLDDVDRALVSFYGKLAHGMTRDTFISAEGTGLRPLDDFGRPMYLPPNSAANALFLSTLRYLLIQDWDTDDDGFPDTLRLCYATPKRWLENGKIIEVKNAPTCFGPLSMKIISRLERGEVTADVQLPARNPAKYTRLRIRLPHGWKILSAQEGSRTLAVDDRGTIDISGLKGNCSLIFRTQRL